MSGLIKYREKEMLQLRSLILINLRIENWEISFYADLIIA
jgi:hypothetical protein